MLTLFDIDGTLLLSRGAGLECVGQAFRAVFEREADVRSVNLPGNLDPHIWREMCLANGIRAEVADEQHARFRALYAGLLEERLAQQVGRAYALPGVLALLDALEQREHVTLGLLTGNYAETGRAKIRAAGIDPERFAVAAFGSDGEQRADLVVVARERYAALGRAELAASQVVIIGDTPRDVACARAHGCRSLAVATGRYSVSELEQSGAESAVQDLTDTATILAWLDRTA